MDGYSLLLLGSLSTAAPAQLLTSVWLVIGVMCTSSVCSRACRKSARHAKATLLLRSAKLEIGWIVIASEEQSHCTYSYEKEKAVRLRCFSLARFPRLKWSSLSRFSCLLAIYVILLRLFDWIRKTRNTWTQLNVSSLSIDVCFSTFVYTVGRHPPFQIWNISPRRQLWIGLHRHRLRVCSRSRIIIWIYSIWKCTVNSAQICSG